jgi:hypothetical protein
MKQYIKLSITAIFFTLLFASCEKDEISSPVISNVEIGANNSKKAYVGADLHIEAEIRAEGKIANIRVLIHQETEGEEAPAKRVASSTSHESEWKLDSIYTGVYANVKNTTFHEHVEIPGNVEPGTYHLHLYVTDLDGNQTMLEEEITIAAPNADGKHPTITVSSAPASGQLFSNGTTISISGIVTDTQGLSEVYIGLVKASAGLTDDAIDESNSITLLHNHEFEQPTAYSFTSSIKAGAATDNDHTPKSITWSSGDYYIIVVTEGVDGEKSYSAHYPVKIQL